MGLQPSDCRDFVSSQLSGTFPFPAFLLLLLFFFGLGSDLQAQEDAKKDTYLPKLRWAGDKAGGAPFIYEVEGKMVGFETELVGYLCQEMGRTPEFIQGQYDTLPDVLKRNDSDILVNGFEYIPDREAEFPSTIPYFIYTLRLIAHAEDESIKSWEDLRGKDGKPGKKVGVLRGSFSERYMRETFGDSIDLKPINEVGEMLTLVEGKQDIDATIQDSPAAIYYVQGGKYSKLRIVGEPRAKGYYVILTLPEDRKLKEQLNLAIRKALTSGKMEEIYRRYSLWDSDQERIAYTHLRPWPPETAQEDLSSTATISGKLSMFSLWDKLLEAAGMTLALAFCSMPLAILIGILIALGRLYGPWLLRAFCTAYVEVLRGTPLLLQIFVLFYLIPELARNSGNAFLIDLTRINPFYVGVLGLALNYSAYEAEIYRAGLLAIPPGQMEAALALGMTPATAVRKIVLPQAIRLVIPPVTNDFIALFKDTSVCSMIVITELTGFYYQNKYDREFQIYLALIVGITYLLMSYPLSLVARWLEARHGKGDRS